MKKLFVLFMTILLSIGMVNASEFNINAKGSIDVTVKYGDNTPIKGADIKIYKVADLSIENGIVVNSYVNELNGTSISLKDLDKFNYNSTKYSKNEVKSNIKKIEELTSSLDGIVKTTNSNGHVKFNNLELGVYIVSQVNKVKGYTVLDSYMISVPAYEDDNWIYDIESLPKPEIEALIDVVVTKEWIANSEVIPESINVNLLLNDVVVSTAKITKENNWTYIFEDLQYSRNYTIEEELVDGFSVSYKDAIYNDSEIVFGIVNTGKLPQTGSYTFIVPILMVTGAFLTIVGLYLNKKEKVNE